MPAPSKRWRWLVPLLVVLALVVGLVFYLARPQPAKAPAYEKLTLASTTQTQTVALSGTLRPRDQAVATFAVPGEVTTVNVKVGDTVVKGQPLAAVATTDLDNAVALARANADAAAAQLQAAEDNEKATDAQIKAARAQVKATKASLSQAQDRRAQATLLAPLAGTVGRIGYAVGDQVSGASLPAASGAGGIGGTAAGGSLGSLAGASGITIVATDAWQLDAAATAADLPALKKGQRVAVTPSGTVTTLAGTVDTIGIVADSNAASSASFPVTIAIASGGVPLYAGAAADAVVTTAEVPRVLAAPLVAITTTPDGASSVLVDDGAAGRRTPVTLGRRFGTTVEVTAGVKAGDVVLVPQAQAVAAPTTRAWGGTPSAGPTR